MMHSRGEEAGLLVRRLASHSTTRTVLGRFPSSQSEMSKRTAPGVRFPTQILINPELKIQNGVSVPEQ